MVGQAHIKVEMSERMIRKTIRLASQHTCQAMAEDIRNRDDIVTRDDFIEYLENTAKGFAEDQALDNDD